ncbi:MAG: O-methyltransferase [Clostridiaceae bacterium]|jgi:predicted O-methyltransferase YrrM|nr:O-methyltransferase [Clostridiaceae bacterium]
MVSLAGLLWRCEALENEINYPHIRDYLFDVTKHREPLLVEMEEYAINNHIPVIQRESSRLLRVLCTLARPRRILEVGTAIGYSAIILASEMGTQGVVDTIEIDEDRVQEANRYIERSGIKTTIRVIHGDAAEVLQCLTTPYDMIFLDAAKGQYMEFLPHCLRLLNPGGVLVSDNILYRGMVAKEGFIEHKHRTIATRLKAYIDALMSDDNLLTSIIPIGDGMAVSIKK